MKQILILLFLSAVVYSCKKSVNTDRGISIKLVNNSRMNITDIKFYTSEEVATYELEQLAPELVVEGFLSMEENKIDGHYILEYTDQEGEQQRNTGYYTNGAPIEEFVRIEFKADTTEIKFTSLPKSNY